MLLLASKVDVIFFLYHQFITWHVKADRGSYFRNYIHRKQTQRKILKRKRKRKEKKRNKI